MIPQALARKLNFTPISTALTHLKNVELSEIILVNSKTKFLELSEKTCYRMDYSTLSFSIRTAIENFLPVRSELTDSYTTQNLHSMSHEKADLCFYTYAPNEFIQFIELNKSSHYTFLPLTVHAIDSANGYRHDMLIIFNNRTKLFYWFDGQNRKDYLAHSDGIPKNAIDILLTQLADMVKIGYNYEPSSAWMIPNVLQSGSSVGQLDFMLSTAWCYLIILWIDSYDSPMMLMSALDVLDKEDRYHLLYSSLIHLAQFRYKKTISATSQVNLFLI